MTLQTIRINELLLVAVPGEMSTEMGQRLKQAVLQAAQYTRQSITHVAIVGLANQYISYLRPPRNTPCNITRGPRPYMVRPVAPSLPHGWGIWWRRWPHGLRLLRFQSQWIFTPGLQVQAFPEVLSMQGGREAQRVTLDRSTTPPSASFVWEDLSPGDDLV